MADDRRFNWPAILRAAAITAGITAAVGLIVPLAGALVDGQGPLDTRNVSGNQIYRWGFWAVAWALLVWQGSQMLKRVGTWIIDDMLISAAVVAIGLLVVKVIVWIAYEPIAADGQPLFPITGIDAAGALALFVIALVAARANRY